MSRIVYPSQFEKQVALFRSIKQKHDADGAASVLILFLSQNNINLNNDDADAAAAASHHSAFDRHSKSSEALREERDLKMKLPWKHLKSSAQFLKALYPQSPRSLGDWRITVNNKNKLAYPEKFSERITLVKDFIAKHNSFAPGTSPLQIFLSENNIDLALDLASVIAAETVHDQFEKSAREKEREREARDVLWQPVMKNVRAIGSLLKALFRGKEHEAGDYGIAVDSSRRKPHLRRSMVPGGQSITIRGVVIGSIFTNHGTGELHLVRRGKKISKPIIIVPEQTFEIPKGYSALTVFNPLNGEIGIFSSFWHK